MAGRPSRAYLEEIQEIKFEIGKKLVKATCRPNITIILEINQDVVRMLIRRYNLNYGRFIYCENFVTDFLLGRNNYYNEVDFHEIQANSFKMKLITRKIITVNSITNGVPNPQEIESKAGLTIQFTRANEVHLNDEEIEELDQFEANQDEAEAEDLGLNLQQNLNLNSDEEQELDRFELNQNN